MDAGAKLFSNPILYNKNEYIPRINYISGMIPLPPPKVKPKPTPEKPET